MNIVLSRKDKYRVSFLVEVGDVCSIGASVLEHTIKEGLENIAEIKLEKVEVTNE